MRRGQDLNFGEWADFYLENFSKPPFRTSKTHEVNERALKHLRKMFENTKLADLNADDIEGFLRRRLKQRVQVKAKDGFVEKGLLKATTVHQELRVLRRMLNVPVRKKFLFANPCSGVEFPARVDGLFRPHYVTWSEQQKIETAGPEYLRNVIRIVTETGLRIYKELTPMKKEQLDLENGMVWIPDSKTPNGMRAGFKASGSLTLYTGAVAYMRISRATCWARHSGLERTRRSLTQDPPTPMPGPAARTKLRALATPNGSPAPAPFGSPLPPHPFPQLIAPSDCLISVMPWWWRI